MSSPDREGFEEYVVARRAALHRAAYLLTGNHADAEDLVQVALMKAVGRWHKIADRPEPYVHRILVNESISRWRRRRWREVPTDRLPDGPGSDGGTDPARDLTLRDALQQLAPRQRAVIVLRYYEDRTERETAEILGIAVGTVKSQARDGLARLRRLVPDLDGEAVGRGDTFAG